MPAEKDIDSRNESVLDQLSNLFGTYRAEWLRDQLFDLFAEPRYFPELTRRQSCVLVGGRGTGKTTVLKGLSYEGQSAICLRNSRLQFAQIPFIGIYHRVNTNHVTAFQGAGLDQTQWVRLFGHYLNLLVCELILDFVAWQEAFSGTEIRLDSAKCEEVCLSLGMSRATNHKEVRIALVNARISFERFINNVADGGFAQVSMLQRPVDLLTSAVLSLPLFNGKHFFFIIDEYENLLQYQQKVVNTLIKHSPGTYFFKIGVREMGWQCRETLRDHQELISPADYSLIDIGEKLPLGEFCDFAKAVCESRLRRIVVNGKCTEIHLHEALPGLSPEEEAEVLGVDEIVTDILESYSTSWKPDAIEALKTMGSLEVYLFDNLCKAQGKLPSVAIHEVLTDRNAWKERYENHKYAALYAIRKGKRGIDKYYCGFETLALMAGGNIRYLLELVDQSFLLHVRNGGEYGQSVSHVNQTKAAQKVGEMNLSELEGVSVKGAQLSKLLLGMGRVFQNLAATPFGHTSEVNQFYLDDMTPDVSETLRLAVMHLAIKRYPATKLTGEGDTMKEDYGIHPIYSALFEFSPRRKRKMKVSSSDIDGLIHNTKNAIEVVLRRQNRKSVAPLPRQLQLFTEFYSDDC